MGQQGVDETAIEWTETIWDDVVDQLQGDGYARFSIRTLLKRAYGKSPIDPSVIDETLAAEEWGLDDAYDREAIGTALQMAQIDWVTKAGPLLDYTYSPTIPGVHLAAVTRSRIYIEDHQKEWANKAIGGILSSTVQEVMKETHRKQSIVDGVRSEDLLDEDGLNMIVIEKPTVWAVGESNMEKDLTYMVYAGLSPTEAIDYLAVRRGISQRAWARHWRDRRESSISENVAKAEETLQDNRSELINPENIDVSEYKIQP